MQNSRPQGTRFIRLGVLALALAGATLPATAAVAANWIATLEAKLLTPDPEVERSHFGRAVAVEGATAVVNGYVLERDANGRWAFVAGLKRFSGERYPFRPGSAAISGDTIVLGDPYYGGGDRGAAWVFVKPVGGWAGVVYSSAMLEASDPSSQDRLGASVAIVGDTIVAGASLADHAGISPGAAYVFVEPPGGWSGQLQENAKLLASDLLHVAHFGWSVATDGNHIAVGARNHYEFGPVAGSAYVFEKPAGGWSGTLVASARLLGTDTEAGDHLGESIGIHGGTVIVGAWGTGDFGDPDGSVYGSGSAYVFREPAAGWSGVQSETAKLVPSDPALMGAFGMSVSVSGSRVLIGAPTVNTGAHASGAAYAFVEPVEGWSGLVTEIAKLSPFDPDRYDRFGSAVAWSGHTVLVGSQYDDEAGYWDGSAYVYAFALCGNEIVEGAETCDDGNETDFDGCQATCQTTTGTILDFYDDAVDAGALVGTGSGNSASNRLATLANLIESVQALVEGGEIAEACDVLASAQMKTDGIMPPPDFVAGDAAAELLTWLEAYYEGLGCGELGARPRPGGGRH